MPLDAKQRAEAFDSATSFATRSKTHLWTAMAVYSVNPDLLAVEEPVGLLDPEKMLSLTFWCMVCSAKYDPHLRHRACPGPQL